MADAGYAPGMGHLPVRRILVPTDLSRQQTSLHEYAIGLARQMGAELLFFSVIDSPTTMAMIERHPSAESAAGFRAKLVADAKVLLKRLVDRATEQSVRASGHAVVSERVGDEVVREARDRHVDVIVVATEQHSVFWRVLFGDSAEKILHLAPCPVLLVKTRDDVVR